MIQQIIKLIQSDKWMGVSPEVDRAKGLYELTFEWDKVKQQMKRKWLTRQ